MFYSVFIHVNCSINLPQCILCPIISVSTILFSYINASSFNYFNFINVNFIVESESYNKFIFSRFASRSLISRSLCVRAAYLSCICYTIVGRCFFPASLFIYCCSQTWSLVFIVVAWAHIFSSRDFFLISGSLFLLFPGRLFRLQHSSRLCPDFLHKLEEFLNACMYAVQNINPADEESLIQAILYTKLKGKTMQKREKFKHTTNWSNNSKLAIRQSKARRICKLNSTRLSKNRIKPRTLSDNAWIY